MTQHKDDGEHSKSPEGADAKKVYENVRGENIDARLVLVTDKERGPNWLRYIGEGMPREVFERFGLFGVDGSEEYENLVEHSANVAAAAVTLAEQLNALGLDVDVNLTERAAWVHDAAKRRDILTKVKREDEQADGTLARILAENNYTSEEIAAALNTGRLADRYLLDPRQRRAAIAGRTLEENIVGYVDARARGARFASLAKAREGNVAAKPRDEDFFTTYWEPYYKEVEAYFAERAPGFNPDDLNEDTIFATVQRETVGAA